jgi:radical SAM protein with 4Fe4S-binding SPASM domain
MDPQWAMKIFIRIPFFKRYYPLIKRYNWNHYAQFQFNILTLKRRLDLLRPHHVQWLTTYHCNFKCIHCEASAGTRNVCELTTEEAFNLVDQLKVTGVKSIMLSGGEPLVRKDVFLIIKYILDRGLTYSIASNGFLVDQFKEQFRTMKPTLYFTSIDGLEKTNDEIRGVNGAFKKCLKAVKFFQDIGIEKRIINTVVLPNNISQLPELKKIIQDSGATLWRIAVPIPVGRAKDNEQLSLSKEQMKYLFEFIQTAKNDLPIELSEDAGYLGCLESELRDIPFFCGAGLSYCAIMPDGEVLGCQIAYDTTFSEGNIRTRSFNEIWHQGFSRFREPQVEPACSTCKYLNACRGGCWGMRLGNKHCHKEVWDEKTPDQ